MRIILFTGKGGVGKTCIAAATAVRTAEEGYRTLVMSTDQAHSLSDCFEMKLGGEITPVAPGLDALEVDMAKESRRAWGNLKEYLRQIIAEKARGGIAAEEALLFPGLAELSSLLRILELCEEGGDPQSGHVPQYDVLIVDCAPTGETLSLLRYPEQLAVLTDKILPMLRSITSAFGNLITRATSVPKPRDAVFAELDVLVKRLCALREILCDRKRTSLRIVMTPEKIVIEEAARSYMWLSAFDFGVDAVMINRIWPDEALEGDFAPWKDIQKEHLEEIEARFPNQKKFFLQLQREEVRGMTMLRLIAEALYGKESGGENDPARIFCEEEAYTFRRDISDGSWCLLVRLPGAEKEEIDIRKEEGDLILTVRNETRRMHLPDQAARRRLYDWETDGELLRIRFDTGTTH